MKLGLKCTAGLILLAWVGLGLWACSTAAPRATREPSATAGAEPTPTAPDAGEGATPPTAAATQPSLTAEQQVLVQALLLAAQQLQREGRYGDAAETLRRVLRVDPASTAAREQLAGAESSLAFLRAANTVWGGGLRHDLLGFGDFGPRVLAPYNDRWTWRWPAPGSMQRGLTSQPTVGSDGQAGDPLSWRDIDPFIALMNTTCDGYGDPLPTLAGGSSGRLERQTFNLQNRPASPSQNEAGRAFPDTVNSSYFYITGGTVSARDNAGLAVPLYGKGSVRFQTEANFSPAPVPGTRDTATGLEWEYTYYDHTTAYSPAPPPPTTPPPPGGGPRIFFTKSTTGTEFTPQPDGTLLAKGSYEDILGVTDTLNFDSPSTQPSTPAVAGPPDAATVTQRQETIGQLTQYARRLVEAERFDEGREVLRGAFRIEPGNQTATNAYADLLREERLALRQRQIGALTVAAQKLEAQGRYAEAEQKLGEAMQVDPSQTALQTRCRELHRKAYPLVLNAQPGEELLVIARRPAATRYYGDDAPGTGSLLAKREGQAQPLAVPLKHTDVQAGIEGYIATVDVTQQYTNPFDTKIEAVYVFPLPTSAAINEFVMTVGERRIRGIIREREQAQQIYAAAKAQGYVASLMTQERPNIFTQSVANIEPGKDIDIRIRYFHTLEYADGWYEFAFPMVVGPRYNPAGTTDGVGAVASDAAGASGQATEVSYLRPDERSGHDIAVAVRIDAGVAIERVDSRNHRVAVRRPTRESAYVELAADDTIPNKDFVLRYQVAGERVKSGLVTYTDEHGGFFTLMVYPPAQLAQVRRQPMEMIFVLDCSGSMQGEPLAQVKDAVQTALALMEPDDTFQVIRFSDKATQFGTEPVAATRENVERAIQYVVGLNCEGGTEMLTGIKAALDFPHDPRRVRTVAFLTDGFIGNEQTILSETQTRLGDTRIFSFGVGSSPNRHLMDGLASFGHGAVAYLGLNDDAAEVMMLYFERISHPALTDATIAWGAAEDGTAVQVSDVYPQRVPDLFVGRPIVLTGRFTGPLGRVPVQITGRVGTETRTFEVVAAKPPKPRQMLAAKAVYVAPSAPAQEAARQAASAAANAAVAAVPGDPAAYGGVPMDDPAAYGGVPVDYSAEDGGALAVADPGDGMDAALVVDDPSMVDGSGGYAVAIDPDGGVAMTTPDDGSMDNGAGAPAVAGTQQAPEPGMGQRVPGPEFGADNPGATSPANANAVGAAAGTAANAVAAGAATPMAPADAAADDTAQHHGLPAVWARLKIAELSARLVKEPQTDWAGEIRKVALEYGLLSSYTAFVAVDSMARTAGEATTVAVPVPVPDGTSFEATVRE